MREFITICRNVVPSLVTASIVVLADNIFDVASTWSAFLFATGVALSVTCVDTMVRKGVR